MSSTRACCSIFSPSSQLFAKGIGDMQLRAKSVTALALAGLVFIGVATVHQPAYTRAQGQHPIHNDMFTGAPKVQTETLLQAGAAWDGVPYQDYPQDRPERTVVKLTIPPHTALPWHTHAMPNAAYVVSGQIHVERQSDGLRRQLGAGQVLAEMIDSPHWGVTADEPAVLIVFYAGNGGAPLAKVNHE